MAKSLDAVLSHWHHSIDDFHTSTVAFYTSVEEGLARREIPDLRTSRVQFAEAGIASAKREYLRVERRGLIFDACAAPFGRGFFVSWWLTQPPVAWWIVLIASVATFVSWTILYSILSVLFGGGGPPALLGSFFGMIRSVFVWGMSVALWFGAVHLLVQAKMPDEEVVLAIPGIGWVYRAIFAPVTYYKLDTAKMFGDMVHTAVLETLDAAVAGKGIRALTESERKPIMRGLLGP